MSLIKHSAYNILGFAIPTIVSIPAFGVLSRWLSIEEFGVFTLTFAIVGYASIFDAGLSRAVTREVSIYREDTTEQSKILGTANLLILFLCLIASFSLFVFSPYLATYLKITSASFTNVVISLRLLTLAIPFYIFNLIWTGYLEGMEDFLSVNIQKSISNSIIVLLPVLFCMIEKNIIYATFGLVIGRLISIIITSIYCRIILKKSKFNFDKKVFKRLLDYGSWITVSNIISPIMVYFDKFIVSNILGAQKVAFYTAPAEGVNRMINIPIALTKVLFPKINNAKSLDEQINLEKYSYVIITCVCLPFAITGFCFAKEIMTIWMGAEYGENTADVLKILLFGYYFNSIAQIPYTILQSKGFSKYTAAVHAIEIIPYLILLYYFTKTYGLIGAAGVWTVRVIVDFWLLFFASSKVRNIKDYHVINS